MIGKLQRVPLRDVWKHEALDFTKWLETNPDVLSDIIGVSLSNIERERSAGSFNVDLVAEDQSGNPVIIENQLERSNHDHLGKLITYLSAIESKIAVWIVADPRPEHVKAIAWLNDSSSGSFYLLKIEAVRIGDSMPAPLLTLIVGPSEESEQIGSTKKDIARRHSERKEFWIQLLQVVKTKTKLHANLGPSHDNWISTGAGKSGLVFSYVIRMTDSHVELYIDTGDEHLNKSIFNKLLDKKNSVEESFGDALDWQILEGRRASRIAYYIKVGGLRDREKWPEIQEAMVEAMICLERALRSHINELAM